MNRRKLCFLSAAFLLGIAAAEYRQTFLWGMLVPYGLAWMRSIWSENKGAAHLAFWTAAFVLSVFAGSFDSYYHRQFRNAYEEKLKDDASCLVQGKIYQKEKKNDQILFYLKDCRVQLDQKIYVCNQILLYLNASDYSIGEILCVKGKIKTFSLPSNDGNYNERQYYQSLKIDFKVSGERVVFRGGKKDAFRELLSFWKEKITESYQNAMPERDAGVLLAMTLGEKGQMEKGRSQTYRDAGISHFYSISGLHISMLGMALYQWMKRRSGSFLAAGGISAALIFVYGELTGFGISASRAIGMFFLLLYAKCRGRSYDRPTALFCMAAFLAGKNPGILHHAGYLLSFGAVGGVLLAEWLLAGFAKENGEEASKESRMQKAGKKMREAILASFCIQFMTIPILRFFFYEISVYAVFVNLFVLPCMGALLGFGIFGGIMGCMFPAFGKILLYPCHLILLFYDFCCGCFLKLPNSLLIMGTASVFWMICWYGSGFLFLAARKCGKRPPVFLLAAPLVVLLWVQKAPEFAIDVLDVGQGDGAYVSFVDGTSVFIDGGSSSVSKVGTYRILPFLKYKGVRRVDYWFVSHCDADHINGLLEVMDAGYEIKNLVVSGSIPKDAAWEALKESAKENKIPVLFMDQGACLKSSEGSFRITCLLPSGGKKDADRNANSLGLLFETGRFRALFAGDIGEEQEKELLRKWELPRIDVYKASHHGSDYSNCSELLQKIRPKITVISCGRKNRYGHPGKKAVNRILKAKSKIYETGVLGQIKIRGEHLEEREASVLEWKP